MIDIVIPLGRFSKCADKEMMYSLRSIEKNLEGWNKIYIIGYAPKFLNETDRIVVIPAEDYSLRKQENIFKKLLMACEDPFISDPFIATADDIFFKEKTNVNDINHWFHSDLKYLTISAKGIYQLSVKNTYEYLSKNNLPIKNFDIHMPIRYEKEKMMGLLEVDWTRDHIIKSLYCNVNKIKGSPSRHLNFSARLTVDQIHTSLKDVNIFAVNGESLGLSQAMFSVLQELFPDKSTFEK